MGSDSIPLWIIFILCVIGGAYFAATESSFSAVNKIKIKAPVLVGDVIISNVLNLGVDIVATRDVKESK